MEFHLFGKNLLKSILLRLSCMNQFDYTSNAALCFPWYWLLRGPLFNERFLKLTNEDLGDIVNKPRASSHNKSVKIQGSTIRQGPGACGFKFRQKGIEIQHHLWW